MADKKTMTLFNYIGGKTWLKEHLKKEVDKDYSNPHRGGKTGRLSSLVRLFYYIFDYIYGYRKIVKPVLFRRGVVIFDRYYTDIVADSKRSRINIPYKVIMSLKFLIPNMKLTTMK